MYGIQSQAFAPANYDDGAGIYDRSHAATPADFEDQSLYQRSYEHSSGYHEYEQAHPTRNISSTSVWEAPERAQPSVGANIVSEHLPPERGNCEGRRNHASASDQATTCYGDRENATVPVYGTNYLAYDDGVAA